MPFSPLKMRHLDRKWILAAYPLQGGDARPASACDLKRKDATASTVSQSQGEPISTRKSGSYQGKLSNPQILLRNVDAGRGMSGVMAGKRTTERQGIVRRNR